MMQPEAATTIKRWLERFAEATRDAEAVETSAGAGPGRDYAYLHYRTGDDRHSALVLRAVLEDGRPEVRAVEIEAGPDEIRDRMNDATHGGAALRP